MSHPGCGRSTGRPSRSRASRARCADACSPCQVERQHHVWPAACRVEDATRHTILLPFAPYHPKLLTCTPCSWTCWHPWLASVLPRRATTAMARGSTTLPPRRPTASSASSPPTPLSKDGSTPTAPSGACATPSCHGTSRGAARSTTGSPAAATCAASPRRASAPSLCDQARSATS